MSSCVVLDTSVWRQEHLLRSNIGTALLFELHRQGIVLGLPEIVEREVPVVVERHGAELVDAASDRLRRLAQLMGSAPDPSLPSRGGIRVAVLSRLDELDALLVKVPYTLAHARGALDRVIDPSSPFAKSEEYKDAAIWEAVLSLADEYDDVYFVSLDRVFFDKGAEVARFAVSLDRELESTSGQVLLFRSLADCVEHLQEDAPPVDGQAVVGLLRIALQPTLVKDADRYGYEPGPVINAAIRPFVTEDPRALSMGFEVKVNLEDATGAGRSGHATAYGDCRYEPDENAVTDVQMDRVVFDIEGDEGESRQHRSVYLRGTVGVGSRQRVHQVRLPLAGSEYLVISSGAGAVTIEAEEELPGLS